MSPSDTAGKHASTSPRPPQTSSIFIDESGSKATASKCFVVAGVKLRRPGGFARAIRSIRDSSGFDGEFKFGRISRGNYSAFTALVDALAESDAHLAATIIDGKVHNPYRRGQAAWRTHAEIISQLLVGCINRGEMVGVHLDGISTPTGCSLEDTVKAATNRRLAPTSVVSCVALDSRTSDLLQAADLVAGGSPPAARGPRPACRSRSWPARRAAAALARPAGSRRPSGARSCRTSAAAGAR